jgi:hypothetical protein
MIVLDTNVISELMHVSPDQNVVAWMNHQPRSSIWLTAITIFEINYGLEIMASGRKQLGLRNSFEVLLSKFEERIALFDQPSAQRAAELMASRQKRGMPRDLRDTMIAGIVVARHANLATRNVTHFSDIRATVINPWASK